MNHLSDILSGYWWPSGGEVAKNGWGGARLASASKFIYLLVLKCVKSPWEASLEKGLTRSLMHRSVKRWRRKRRYDIVSVWRLTSLSNCLKSYWLPKEHHTSSVWSLLTVCNPFTRPTWPPFSDVISTIDQSVVTRLCLYMSGGTSDHNLSTGGGGGKHTSAYVYVVWQIKMFHQHMDITLTRHTSTSKQHWTVCLNNSSYSQASQCHNTHSQPLPSLSVSLISNPCGGNCGPCDEAWQLHRLPQLEVDSYLGFTRLIVPLSLLTVVTSQSGALQPWWDSPHVQ